LELKGKSGIYGFLCRTTNKLYIGSSVQLFTCFNEHLKGFRSNTILQNAINKYNLQDFIFIVFEYCEPEDLISREQFYLDALEPEFNILKVAGSSLGYKHTEELLTKLSQPKSEITRAKISLAQSGENNPMFGRTGENHPMFGRTGENHPGKSHSEETKVLISLANKGKIRSAETIAKISVAKGGGTIYVYDSQGSLVNIFSSTRGAAEFFNCSHITIAKYVKNNLLF